MAWGVLIGQEFIKEPMTGEVRRFPTQQVAKTFIDLSWPSKSMRDGRDIRVKEIKK